MRKKKAASLTGSLLTQDKTDPSTGFVISLVERLKETQSAADTAPKRPKRKSGKPATERAPGSDLSVDFVDSSGPKPARRKARLGGAGEGSGRAEGAARGTSTRRRQTQPYPADRRPAASLEDDDAKSAAPHLVQALRDGDLENAEILFGRLTGLNAGQVRRVLYGAEGRNLAIACRALGIEQLQFVSIFMLSRRLGLGEKAPEPRKLTQIVSFFDQSDKAAARKTLNQWLCYSSD
jgi:hypothetical protein